MTEFEPLTQDEYDRLMRWSKVGRRLGESGSGWAEALWDRHAATVPQDDVERGAVHEAGHAAVAHACGWTVKSMKLLPNGEGFTTYGIPMATNLRERVREVFHTAMAESAGLVAEEVVYNVARYPDRAWYPKVKAAWEDVHSGLEQSHPALRALIPSPLADSTEGQVLAFVDEGERLAGRVLARNMDVLSALAENLLERRYLGMADLTALLARAIPGDGLNAR